jgi:hypothetical protein
MSKFTQIEIALKSINPGRFQALWDAYLNARGYRNVNPIGRVVGDDKTKTGTPDSLVSLPNGNYLFGEWTTQKDGVAGKFLEDIAKCFDERKTGIPKGRIQEIVCGHTSVLSTEDEQSLIDEGRRRGCLVTPLGIGPISLDLFNRYRWLAREFLEVDLDTGQILSLDDFVAAYGKNALATPLNTSILFREPAIADGVNRLATSDVLLVGGPSGVGKTRLALEVCRKYVGAHPEAQAHAVLSRGVSIFEDVRIYFGAPGEHLVFVDDANRLTGFDYILQLLHEQNPERQIKIVATVRDYALGAVQEVAKPYGGASVMQLAALEDKQIREIVQTDFGIKHHLYTDQIVEVSQGNPRIAVMAARLAVREQSLKAISDVSALYEEYFASIKRDLIDLDDPELLRAAGILAYFRRIDRKDEKQTALIRDAFGADPDRLWTCITRLHDLEIVDLYDGEIAKTADQVLATFVFHLAFFRERVLDPAALLHPLLFPKFRSTLFDALNPALTAFDAETITKILSPIIRARWDALETEGDEPALFAFVNAFGPVDITGTLRFVQRRVAGLPTEPPDLDTITFKEHSSSEISLWSIIGLMRDADLDIVKMALGLATDLLARRPNDTPDALYTIGTRFGVRPTSYLRDYEVQRAAIETLWSGLEAHHAEPVGIVFRWMFFQIAERLLHTEFETHESKNDRAISFVRFDAPATPALFGLRELVWTHVETLLKADETRGEAVRLIRDHGRSGIRVTNGTILANDAVHVLRMLDGLDPTNYSDVAVVQSYLVLLRSRSVELDPITAEAARAIRERFTNPASRLAELLLDDFEDLRERAELRFEEYEKVRRERLAKHISSSTVDDLDSLIGESMQIRDELRVLNADPNKVGSGGHDDWQIKRGIADIFELVRERDTALFIEFAKRYLDRGNPMELDASPIVPGLLASAGADAAHEILSERQFVGRGTWLSAFFAWLPKEAANEKWLQLMLKHFETISATDVIRNADFLAKYEPLDSRVIHKVIGLLVDKAETAPFIGHALADMFDHEGAIEQRIRELFGSTPEDILLIRRAYFAAAKASDHVDYRASSFSATLDIDAEFGAAWVDWKYDNAPHGYLSEHSDHRDYTRLWLRDDYVTSMRAILDRARVRANGHFFQSYAAAFMRITDGHADRTEVSRRQYELLKAWIAEGADDPEQMQFVFTLVVGLSDGQRRELLSEFLTRNTKFDDFKALPLESTMWSWSGSEVPLLQKRVEFYESLVPLLATIDVLEHREHVEGMVRHLRERMAAERRQDFLEH